MGGPRLSRLRGLAERLSRERVVARRMPAAAGGARVFVSPDVALRFWKRDLGTLEPQLLAWASELAPVGGVTWDVGASVGLFAVAAAHRAGRAGRVVAIEADPWVADLLRRTAEGLPSSHARVVVLSQAVAETEGTVDFVISRRGRAANHLSTVTGSSQAGGERRVVSVPCRTLDGLLAEQPAPDLLKIDVEGAELLALRGATELLARHRPAILCEVSGGNREAVTRLLEHARYDLFDAELPADDRRPLALAAWNTLALPRPSSAEAAP